MDWFSENIIWIGLGFILLIAVIRTIFGIESDHPKAGGSSEGGISDSADGGGEGGGD